jgi:hypothetical protein
MLSLTCTGLFHPEAVIVIKAMQEASTSGNSVVSHSCSCSSLKTGLSVTCPAVALRVREFTENPTFQACRKAAQKCQSCRGARLCSIRSKIAQSFADSTSDTSTPYTSRIFA